MRKLVLFVWLLVPVAAAAYHYGPGQERMRSDDASDAAERALALVREAREITAKEGERAARGTWAEAEQAFTEALANLPAEHVAQARQLKLERAKAQMYISKLPEARRELDTLVDELDDDPQADPALVASARDALANAMYYNTWLMRLEGAPREEWEREIDAARQNYKLVAEHARARSDAPAAKSAEENLESSIRLARLDIKELQGLPLPSQ